MSPTYTRATIVAHARTWLGTPYHHQASVKHIGCDCLGLVRGLFRELHGREPQPIPGYSRDWAETTGIETLLTAARAHLIEIPIPNADAGDVLVFRWRPHAIAKHVGVLTAPDRVIHALDRAAVTEVSLSPWWRRHTAAAFRFPGTQP